MNNLTIVCCTLKENFEYKTKFNLIIVSPKKQKQSKKVKWIKDPGNSMAIARNLALQACKTEYIAYVGDDNEISDEALENGITFLKELRNVAGIGFMTRIKNEKTYFEKCVNMRYKHRFWPGVVNTIGTPCIFITNIIKKIGYDTSLKSSDDVDICSRLRANGYKIAFSPLICYEKGRSGLTEIKKRYLLYGQGDFDIYNKNSKLYSFKEKTYSIFRPLLVEFQLNLYFLPFYFIIVYFRYLGWIRAWKKFLKT